MPQPAAPDPVAPDRLRGRLMAASLGALLNRAPGAREVLPHLAALERGLLDHGVGAIDRVPTHGLMRICSQLASLPLPEDDSPLQDLLQRLQRTLAELQREWEPSGTFDPERTVVIREITHSEFMAASDQQADTMPLPLR